MICRVAVILRSQHMSCSNLCSGLLCIPLAYGSVFSPIMPRLDRVHLVAVPTNVSQSFRCTAWRVDELRDQDMSRSESWGPV
jgi:hypothetical protein